MTLSDDGNRVFRIRLLRGDKVIRTYKIASESVTIGSASECTLKLAGDRTLMPKHATLYQEDGEVTVVPESGAMVLLNDESVDFGVVEPDDILKIGKMTFGVELIAAGDSIVPESGRQSRAPKTQVLHGGGGIAPSPKQTPAAPVRNTMPAASARSMDRNLSQPPKRSTYESVAVIETRPPKASIPLEISPYEAETRVFSMPVRADEPSESLSIDIDDEMLMADDAPTLKTPSAPSRAPTAEEPVSVAASAAPRTDERDEITPFDFTADDYFFDDEDDPEEDEFFFAEPFNLSAALTGPAVVSEKKSKIPLEPFCAADVVRTTDDRVVEMEYVRPGRKYRAAFDDIVCRSRDTMVELQVDTKILKRATKGGASIDLSTLSGKRGRVTLTLKTGDSAIVEGKGGTYRIDAYHPPVAPMSSSIGFSTSVFSILGGAIVLHLTVGLLAFAVYPEERQQKDIEDEQEFAVVEMEKPEFKKDEEQKPEPKPVEKDATSMAERAPKVSNVAVKRIRERADTAKPSSSVSSLLNVLSRGSGKEGKTNNIKDLVSNIDAVGVGSGTAAYNIAGAIASLPGGDVNVAREGGGGAIATMSGEQVAGKGSNIAELARSKPSGKIRGKVTKMSSGAKVKGSLSREDISRVVNSNIHAVQACYEKALLRNPGLSGRIVFDWTVKKDGGVSGVRVRSSTLGNSDVSSCISDKIKKWKFPRPKGGEVIVTYPFLFRSVSS